MRVPVHIWIREENATPEELAGYFTELARRLDAHPQKMRLMIESSVPAVLDFDPADGEPVVSVGGQTQKFSLRHRWLPEHPVPLPLGPVPASAKKCVVLLIDPIDGNRFRVRSRRVFWVPRSLYALFAVVAVAAVITFHPFALTLSALLLIALIVISLQS